MAPTLTSRNGGFRIGGSFCTGICSTFDFHKKRGESVYKYAVLCSNRQSYIPRSEVIRIDGYKKFACPCCRKNWLKGLYKQIAETKHRNKSISTPTLKTE